MPVPQDPNPYAAPATPDTQMTDKPPEFAPCPQCQHVHAQRVGWTLWGGFLGPRLLTHVKCQSCNHAYNGKTGQSNFTAIMIYFAVILGAALCLGLVLSGR